MNRHTWILVGTFVIMVLRSADCPRHRQYRLKKPGRHGQTIVVMSGPNAIVIGLELGGIKQLTHTMTIGIIDPRRAVTLRSPPIRPATEQSQVPTPILHDAIAIMLMTSGGAIIIEAPHQRLLGTHTDNMMIATIVDIERTGRKIPSHVGGDASLKHQNK